MGATVGRDVPVLFAAGTSSSDPASLAFVRLGMVRDRGTGTEWDTIDATGDTSAGLTKGSLTGFKQADFSFSYVVTGEDSQRDFEDIADSDSPYCWLQVQFSSGYRTAYCIIKSVKRVLGRDDVVIAQVEAIAAQSPVVINPGPAAPTLASIEAYRTGPRTWKGVPWGDGEWIENGITYRQVIDIYAPAVTIEDAPFIGRFHAASSPYDIEPGGGMDTEILQKASAAGMWVFPVACRHPALSSTPTQFFDDEYGRAVQFIRSLAPALGFDPAKFYVFTQSRGSGMLIQNLLPDLVNADAPTYAGRQSSRGIKMAWSINPQSHNRSSIAGQKFLIDQTQINLLLAAYPDDARQRNAADLLLTADESVIPLFVAQYDAAYQADKVTFSVMQANGGITHYPNMGLAYRESYVARGLRDKIVVTDQSDGFENVAADFVPTIQAVEAGIPLAWAVAIARSARLGHSLIAIPQSLAGVAVNPDGTGGAPAVGGTIGGIADKSQGINSTSTTGGAGQNQLSRRPKLVAIGPNYGAEFDDTDRLVCLKTNSGAAGCLVSWSTTAMSTAVVTQDTTSINWTVGTGNTQTVTVIGAEPLDISSRRIYSSLATLIAGADLYAVTT